MVNKYIFIFNFHQSRLIQETLHNYKLLHSEGDEIEDKDAGYFSSAHLIFVHLLPEQLPELTGLC